MLSFPMPYFRTDGSFSPNELSGLQLWLDANSGNSVLSDGAANFTAASNQYLATSSAIITSGAFTFACWVKSTAVSNTVRFMVQGSIAGATDRQFIETTGSKFAVTSGTASAAGATTLSNNTWYFCVLTNDGVNSTFYLNGAVEIAAFADAPVYTGVDTFILGSSRTHTFTLNGAMDSAGVWNRALSAAEITYLYNAGSGRVYADLGISGTDGSNLLTSLKSWWGLNEEIGTRFDASGNGNHLAASNTVIISPSPATLNGGFETAGAGGADVFANWVETTGGTSSINDETVTVHSGSNACRFDVDSTGGQAQIAQGVIITGNRYSVSLWARGGTGTPSMFVGTGSTLISFTLTTSYAQYATSFVADQTTFIIKRNSANSNSIYIDDVVLTDLGPTGTTGIAAGVASDGNFCAQLNGTSQKLSVASNSTLQVQGNFSLCAWVNADSIVGAHGIATKWNVGPIREYGIFSSSTGTLQAAASADGTTGTTLNSSTVMVPGTWYLAIARYDGSTLKIKVNNGTDSTTAFAGPVFQGAATFQIGNYDTSQWFPGRIDGVGFWNNHYLSDAECTALFNNGMGLKQAGLAAAGVTAATSYWDLDKKGNGITADSAGSNTLTNTGSTTFGQGVAYYSGVVAKELDQSGSGNNATQTTQSKRPAYQTSIQNGKPMLLFDGVSDLLSIPSLALSTAHTAFIVVKPVALSGVLIGGAANNQLFSLDATNVTYNAQASSVAVAHGMSANTTYILAVWRSGTTVRFYKNGVQLGTDQTLGANNTLTVSAIGAYSDGTSPTNSYLADDIIYNSALSAGQIAQEFAYLNAKHAVY